jgi:hypothetical protein
MDYKNRQDCVWHDGVRIKDSALVAMAKRAGSYALAEHYMVSLMAHGLIYGYNDYIDLVNEVRAYYQVEKIPVPKQDAENHDGQSMTRQRHLDHYRKTYQKMTAPEKEHLLQKALKALIGNYPKLFRKKNHWLGIYLVMRDRLDYGLSQCGFLVIASHATPELWPDNLKLTDNIFKNMNKVFDADSFDEAYYEMDYNPMVALCDTFWEVLMQQFEA